ncbi:MULTISPECIES: hypothetical protein [Bradyrhizobium]|uniref:hypothetical protein n=1 Tax=Bradyrhizobium TaxID=374 RepID=UPI00235CD69E|nr:hypothetical protein [Bradyrhizobium liaoningense]WLB93201.1 hypothetical protein QIH91_34735 [Bradyrhizobium japonicum USDA 135]GLR96423.1 hypothetical protein GCM10007858_40600 [Bradyrhizobium liaoningense]
MLKEGKYAAWFRTAQAQGTGIVHVAQGRISGSDSFFTYGPVGRSKSPGYGHLKLPHLMIAVSAAEQQ